MQRIAPFRRRCGRWRLDRSQRRRAALSQRGIERPYTHQADAGVASPVTLHQALGLGRIFDKVGRRPEATRCYERAARPGGRADDDTVSAEALQRLARHCRSERRYHEAAEAWRRLLALRRPPARLVREATVALAVHHEHRVRDLVTAQQFARRAIEIEANRGRRQATEHRLRRLRRKMERNERCAAATPVLGLSAKP